jgi:hypothetical protein
MWLPFSVQRAMMGIPSQLLGMLIFFVGEALNTTAH